MLNETTEKKVIDFKGYRNIALVVLIGVVCLFGVAKAYQSQKANTVIENVENLTIENSGDQLSGVDGMLSGQATTSLATITELNDLSLNGCIRLADPENTSGNWTQKAMWECVEVIDFTDATSTLFSFENRKGRRMWINDWTNVTLTGVPSSTARIVIGTSTTQYVNPYDGSNTDLVQALAGNANGYNSIIYTGNISSANAATNTSMYFKADYQGKDGRDGTGSFYLVPVEPGQFIVGAATSTIMSAVTSTDSYFNGQVKLRYFLIDN